MRRIVRQNYGRFRLCQEKSLEGDGPDKATVEVPAPAAGTVTRFLVPEGAQVQAGELLVEMD